MRVRGDRSDGVIRRDPRAAGKPGLVLLGLVVWIAGGGDARGSSGTQASGPVWTLPLDSALLTLGGSDDQRGSIEVPQ